MKKHTIFNKIDKYAAYSFTIPVVALYLIFFIYPLIQGLLYSFTDWNGLDRKYSYIGVKNYIKLFLDDRVRNSFNFTFRYTIALIFFTIVLGLIIALILCSTKKGQSFFKMVYFFPAVLSTIIVGLIWNQLFGHALPAFGKMIGSEVLSRNILSNPKLVFYGILFSSLWQGLAVPVLLFIAGLQTVPQELLEASTLDGATSVQQFWKIKFPFLIPVFNIVVILTAKNGLTAFDSIFAMTNGGPGRQTETVGLLVYNFAFTEFKFSYANALGMMIFVLVGIISIVQIFSNSKKEVQS